MKLKNYHGNRKMVNIITLFYTMAVLIFLYGSQSGMIITVTILEIVLKQEEK